MNQQIDLRTPVRRELGLEASTRNRRGRRLLGLAAAGALLGALAAGPTAAQAPYQMEVLRGFSSLTVGTFSTPALVDLDGDGDIDVAAGNSEGTLHYFENTGSSGVSTFVGRTGAANPLAGIQVVQRSAPAFGDLDGDGDEDVVVGEGLGGVRYFRNTGSATLPAFVEATGTANPLAGFDVGDNFSPALADLDGDGDLDALVGESTGTLRYFANTGGASAPAFVERTGSANPLAGVDVGDYSALALADLDGDGDLDAVVGASNGAAIYFTNTGTSTAPSFVAITGTASPFPSGSTLRYESAPALADLDHDGDLDTLLGERLGGFDYLANTGTASAPAFSPPPGSANPFTGVKVVLFSSPELVDLDGDGDRDVVLGEQYGTLIYLRNTGSSIRPGFAELIGTNNPFAGFVFDTLSSPDLADLDGDADLDAVVGSDDGQLRYLENTGSATLAAFVERVGSANPVGMAGVLGRSAPEMADLDTDGDLDLVVGEVFGTVVYFENTGSSSVPLFVERTGSADPFPPLPVTGGQLYGNPEVLDLDGDGDLDAVLGIYDGTLRYLQNVGTSSAPAFVEVSGSTSPFAGVDAGNQCTPKLVDLDGDADLDVLAGEFGGKVIWFRSRANDLFADGFESGDTSAWSLTVP